MILCPSSIKNDAPLEVTENYQITFEDVFVGQTQLDPNKWDTDYYWGPNLTINSEEQYYVDTLGGFGQQPTDPFSFGPNGLIITAEPWDSGIDGINYTSGVINTKSSFCLSEGYCEWCLKPPCNADGSWPAGWLLNKRYYNNAFDKNQAEGGTGDKFNPEIDWPEFVTGGGNTGTSCAKAAYHYFTGDVNSPTNYSRWTLDGNNFIQVDFSPANTGLQSQFNVYQDCAGNNDFRIPEVCETDYCQDFHTYGIHRVPGQFIKFYLDGVLKRCVYGDITDQEMYILLNLAVGGSYPFGNPPSQLANSADYPAQLEIEYVRVYEPPTALPLRPPLSRTEADQARRFEEWRLAA